MSPEENIEETALVEETEENETEDVIQEDDDYEQNDQEEVIEDENGMVSPDVAEGTSNRPGLRKTGSR